MVNKCCVPGCQSNYRHGRKDSNFVSVFEFPKDPDLKDKWIRKIPRENLVITKNTVVCEEHFHECDILRHDVFPGSDGCPDIVIPRKRKKLKEGAIPSIFPNLPSYLSTPTLSKRESPNSKRRKLEEREEITFQHFLDDDIITTFTILKEHLQDKLYKWKTSTCCKVDFNEKYIYIYCLNFCEQSGVSVNFSACVNVDLVVSVWSRNVKINDLSWLIKNDKLERWSQLQNIISHFSCCIPDKVDMFTNALSVLKDFFVDDEDQTDLCNFLFEQLQLARLPPSRRRYSNQCIIQAFCIYSTSPSAYKKIRDNLLILPSIRMLRQLCGNISVKNGLSSFLQKEVKFLSDKDLTVNLLLDEVHVKSKVSFRGGSIVGHAQNNSDKLANSVQCFMISSLLSKKKTIVGLFPVHNMTAEYLHEITLNVLNNVINAGFNIVSIISDNNRINRKMFSLLTKDSDSKFYIPNPLKPDFRIFILYDSVHLLKCIRNNWLNLKNMAQTFCFPKWTNDNCIMYASFSDLKTLYRCEKGNLLKGSHVLCWKALYPHSIERQKVSLALKVFNDTNVATLNTLGPNVEDMNSCEGTAYFIMKICKWWDIVNVHHQFFGRNKIKPNADPFESSDDVRLTWLSEMSSWLKMWYNYHLESGEGFLSKDTYIALTHTIDCLVILIPYLLNVLKFEFVLTGKFQTDNLEGRFGQYRQMSGGNTLISVDELLQSERKLIVKELLQIHSFSKGSIAISVKTFLSGFDSGSVNDNDLLFVNDFPFNQIEVSNESLNIVVYVAGYVAKKLISTIDCSLCCKLIGDKEKSIDFVIEREFEEYFDNLNRGGLTYPSQALIDAFQVALSIMNIAVGDLEPSFKKLNNQKGTLVSINEHYWSDYIDSDSISHFFSTCSDCNQDRNKILLKCFGTFVNILINNYSKNMNESVQSSQSAAKKALKFH